MLADHVRKRRDMTVACIEVPREGGQRLRRDGHRRRERRVTGFVEKPDNPPPCPASPTSRWPMGIYVFNAAFLFEQLVRDADDPIPATTSARTSFRT
jgi:glucose-1-phosphate adenylyltransferase